MFKKKKPVLHLYDRHRKLICFLESWFGRLPLHKRSEWLERCQNMKGSKGFILRFVLLRTSARSCGDYVTILPGVYIKNPQNISFGDHISIHPMCYLNGGRKEGDEYGIFIGNHVSIAHGCSLIPSNHTFFLNEIPIRDQEVDQGFVRIEDNVWLGAKVTVLNRVTIAHGCVLAAGAVLTRSTEPDSVYAGVPARLIKKRVKNSDVSD